MSDRGCSTPRADFSLRPADADDFAFARRLYMHSMIPLLTALDAWDEDALEAAFRSYFIPQEVTVVTQDDTDAGWFQVSRTEQDLCLDQLYLIEAAQGQGIGTALIRGVIAEAKEQGRNVSLSLIKGNPVISLYRRLGFRQTSEGQTKIHMRLVTGEAA